MSQLAFLVHREPTGKLVTRYAFEAAGAAWGAGIRLEGLSSGTSGETRKASGVDQMLGRASSGVLSGFQCSLLP